MTFLKDINKSYIIKGISWIIATVILGGFSTPVWNYMLKPILTTSIDFVMNFLISISKTIENIIYTNIAHYSVLNNTAEIKNIMFIVIVTFGIYTMLLTRPYRKMKKVRDIESDAEKIDFFEKIIKKSDAIISTCDKLLIISVIFICVLSAGDLYSAQLQQDFNYKLGVCAPYLEQKEYLKIKSDFLQIKNKTDYTSIMNILDKILKEHNITL